MLDENSYNIVERIFNKEFKKSKDIISRGIDNNINVLIFVLFINFQLID